MWNTTRELSTIQVHHPSYGAYQHYPTAQIPQHHSNQFNTNLGKWNIAGQRSSYSLPHPGHTQSNMRWNKYEEKSHFLASKTQQPVHQFPARNLTSTSVNRSLFYDQRHIMPAGVGIARHRPASMYDPPNSMPNMSYQFMPLDFQSKKDMAKNRSKNISSSPTDLVSLHNRHINVLNYFIFFFNFVLEDILRFFPN